MEEKYKDSSFGFSTYSKTGKTIQMKHHLDNMSMRLEAGAS